MGHPREFANSRCVKGVWSPVVVEDLQPNNKFTDDTQMFCCIGEALLSDPPHVDENKFMEAVSRNFVVWRDTPLGGDHRAPVAPVWLLSVNWGLGCLGWSLGAYRPRETAQRCVLAS